MRRCSLLFLIAAAVLGLASAAESRRPPRDAPPSNSPAKEGISRAQIIALAEKVADYQLAQLASGFIEPKAAGLTGSASSEDRKGWVHGALFIGLMALADRSDKPHFKQAVLLRGEANKWRLGDRPYHADDHIFAQTYFWAARHGVGERAWAATREQFDWILANPSGGTLDARTPGNPDKEYNCHNRWCWADSIFMAPAAWLELSKVTGDPKYANFAKREFFETFSYLWDSEEQLFYRDSRYFGRRDSAGNKIFWSRGNGWVMAGLAHMIPLLAADDPDRSRLIDIFRQMATRIKAIQKRDGYWAPSLLGDPNTALPEASGTAFYTFALAWGVNQGILSRADYHPTIRNGWEALVRSVHPSGKLGWVQAISDRPDAVAFDDTQYYGAGAFVLAAVQVEQMGLTPTIDTRARLYRQTDQRR